MTFYPMRKKNSKFAKKSTRFFVQWTEEEEKRGQSPRKTLLFGRGFPENPCHEMRSGRLFPAASEHLEHLERLEHFRIENIHFQCFRMPLRRLSAQTKCACAAGVRSRIRQSNFKVKLL